MNKFKVVKNPQLKEEYLYCKHDSGLDIYFVPKNQSSTFATFATRYGSVDRVFKKSTDENFTTVPDGVAHFLEHKMFENEDGTDAFELYAPYGGDANAFTGFNSTNYIFSCTDNFEQNLEVLLNFVTHPYFTKETVEKEQGIIGQEIRMYDDDPGWQGYINLINALYHNHPAKIDIVGTKETIAQITPEILYKCCDVFYNLHNMVLCICGNTDPQTILKVADKVLKKADDFDIIRQYADEPREIVKSRVECEMEVSVPSVYYGIKLDPPKGTPREIEKRFAAISVLSEIIFGPSSEFFLKNYEAGVINNKFGKSAEKLDDIATMVFSAECKNPDAVVKAIEEELTRRKEIGFTDDEFERAKKVMYSESVASFDSVSDIAVSFARSIFEGINIFEIPEIYAGISKEYALECLKREFDLTKAASSFVIPAKKEGR